MIPRKVCKGIIVFLCLFLVACSSVAFLGRSFHSKGEVFLVVKAYPTEEVLFEKPVRTNEIFAYRYRHSVFQDDVHQTYVVCEDGYFVLKNVTSSERVLTLPYPGFEIPVVMARTDRKTLTVEIEKRLDEIMVVAGHDNALILSGTEIPLSKISKDGTILKICLKKRD